LFAALVVVLGAAIAGALGGSPHADAQSETTNTLRSSEPADGDTLDVSPTQLRFEFQSELNPDDALSAPVSCGNQPQSTGVPEVEPDDERIVVIEVLTPFPRGACTVSWVLRDGLQQEITSGLFTFSVQSDPAVTATTAPAAGATTATTVAPAAVDDDTTSDDEGGSTGGALWLGRVLSTIGILVLFGAFVLIAAGWPEGPEYVITVRFLRSVWAATLVGTVLFVIAYTADVTGSSFGSSISPAAWLDLLDAGWPGRAALLRLVAVAATGWVVWRPERVIDPAQQLPAFLLPAAAVVAVGLSRTDGNLAVIGVAVAIAHAFAAAVWIGAAVLVARVVLAGPGDDDLVHAVRAFNRFAGPAVAITVATGFVQLVRLAGGELFTSSYGRVLLLKTIVVAALVFVTLAVRQAVSVRLARAPEMTPANADRFRRSFSAEAGLGIVVVLLSGWLLGLTPPNVDEPSVDYAVELPFADETSGFDLVVKVDPAEIGAHAVRIEVDAPQEGIQQLLVSFVPPDGTTGSQVDLTVPLTGAGTATLDRGVGIPLGVPGTWSVQVSGSTSTGALTGATRTFAVVDPAAVDDATTGATSTTVATEGTQPAGGPIVTVIVDPNLTTTTAAVTTTTTPATTTTGG
jgi:putative copper export protein/methionine-rich copper-binding protein CopC